MTTSTTDVGYAKQKQYQSSGKRKHAVTRDDRERWVLLCNNKPATREYKGWVTTVTCQSCLKELGVEECNE